MITEQARNKFKFRAEMIDQMLKGTNSGADVHEVANIRSIALGVIDILNDPDTQEEFVEPILKRAENRLTDFFKKKFSYLYSQDRNRLSHS